MSPMWDVDIKACHTNEDVIKRRKLTTESAHFATSKEPLDLFGENESRLNSKTQPRFRAVQHSLTVSHRNILAF